MSLSSHLLSSYAHSAIVSTMAGVVVLGSATLDAIVRATSPIGRDSRTVAECGLVAGGGPAATAAVTLARLGVTTSFVGRVGADDAGTLIRAGLKREGVDVRFLRAIRGGRSPISTILVDPATGDRAISTFPGSIGRLELAPDELAFCGGAEWAHVDHVGWPAVPILRTRMARCAISVDGGNPIPDLDLRQVDLYAPAEGELRRASGRTDADAGLTWAIESGVPLAVVTLGAEGALAAGTFDLEQGRGVDLMRAPRDGVVRSRLAVKAVTTTVVSTLGAGDVFHGALLAGLASGLSVRASLDQANWVAAASCAGLDGRSAIPRTGGPPRDDRTAPMARPRRRSGPRNDEAETE